MASDALRSEGSEMLWMKHAQHSKQLLEHFRRLVDDFRATKQLASHISRTFTALTASARTKSFGDDSQDLSGFVCFAKPNSPYMFVI
jgi:hypothetical protein